MLLSVKEAAIWLGYKREKPLLATGVAIFLLAVIGFGEWRLHSDQKNVMWASVGLLLVPAWDFDTDDWLHARMAM